MEETQKRYTNSQGQLDWLPRGQLSLLDQEDLSERDNGHEVSEPTIPVALGQTATIEEVAIVQIH